MFAIRVGKIERAFHRTGVRVFVAVVACAAGTGLAHAQSASLIGGDHVLRMVQQQKENAAEARQKKMENDAAKLVEMAQQLKTSVDKTNKDTLSLNVIKEAERIEKLAREVRDGMRQ